MVRDKELVDTNMKMMYMKDNGRMTKNRAEEFIIGLVVLNMTENGKMGIWKAMDNNHYQMDTSIQGIGRTI